MGRKSREHKAPGTLNSQGKDIWMPFGNTCNNGCCYLEKINDIFPWANGNQGAPNESLEGILMFCPSRGFLPEADAFYNIISDRAPRILMFSWPRIIFPSRGAARIIPALFLCSVLVHFLNIWIYFYISHGHFGVWGDNEFSSWCFFLFFPFPGETHANL